MKILLVSDQLLKIDGDKILGTVNFTNTLKRLASYGELYVCVRDANKYENPILVYNDVMNDYIKKENISFISKSYIWPSSTTIRKINDQIEKVDVVIGYVPALNAEVASFLAHKAGKKYYALMVACPWDGLWNQDWKRKFAAPYRYLLNKIVLSKADYALYVTSQFLQNRYPTKAKLTIGLSDVVLQDTDDAVLSQRLQKISQHTDKDVYKIATIAMLNVKYKGQRYVMEALKQLKDNGFDNFEYYLIGGGDDTVLRNLSKELGISDKVVFVGKVTHEEVFKLLDDMDIYIHPSLQEGLPRSVVEAMSRALPCIGANTGAIPELIDKNFVVKRKSVSDIVEKVLTIINPEIMRKESMRNFSMAKNFECHHLDTLRDNFHKAIANDIENNH